jgi:hypothetical protein
MIIFFNKRALGIQKIILHYLLIGMKIFKYFLELIPAIKRFSK